MRRDEFFVCVVHLLCFHWYFLFGWLVWFRLVLVSFFLWVLPGNGGASGSGAGLFALGTVEPIKLKLQTHEFEV